MSIEIKKQKYYNERLNNFTIVKYCYTNHNSFFYRN